MSVYPRTGILEVMHNVLEDYLIELSSQHQRRPLCCGPRLKSWPGSLIHYLQLTSSFTSRLETTSSIYNVVGGSVATERYHYINPLIQ